MAQRVRRITPEVLKRIIVEEARKIQREVAQEKAKRPEDVDAKETDADELADTLADHVDHYKSLKEHENKLIARLTRVQEAKRLVQKKIARVKK